MKHINPRRPSGKVIAAAVGLSGALAIGLVAPAQSSSHREAPLITEDPTADNTDVYAFSGRDGFTSLISNFQGFQEPGGGPNYYRFSDDVRYDINIDNNGDAMADITYEFRFTTGLRNPNTYQYATGPINDLTDPDWNRPQTYSITRVENGQRAEVATGLRSPPSNVGPRTTPNYMRLASQAVRAIPGGGRVFAGQRDDGFYADAASIFDLTGLRPLNDLHVIPLPVEDGVDTFAGYNVQSIALEIPTVDLLARSGDPVIGVWSTANRRSTRVFANDNSSTPVNSGNWVQVSRLGNPLVNEVIIPLGLKDAYNNLRPDQDAAVLSQPADARGVTIPLVQDPELARLIEALYGINVPDPPRNDLVQIYLTGIPGVNMPQGTVQPADVLRYNTSTNASWPNGRAVSDDVVDTSLTAVAGTPLTDGVQENDLRFRLAFPYLAAPHQGYEIDNPRRVGGP